jgi:hypothetical protein
MGRFRPRRDGIFPEVRPCARRPAGPVNRIDGEPMTEPIKSLLLVIPIGGQDDLLQVVESEGWQTVKDLFKKTNTSYNTHWNGNFVLDQDEIPWKAGPEEIGSLSTSEGKVVVINEGKYFITEKVTLFHDTDGSVYVMEEAVSPLLEM